MAESLKYQQHRCFYIIACCYSGDRPNSNTAPTSINEVPGAGTICQSEPKTVAEN
ncbi:MAG TPA: hypothetical protein V6D15_17385 [Oculatellaceae cyanobacterium]